MFLAGIAEEDSVVQVNVHGISNKILEITFHEGVKGEGYIIHSKFHDPIPKGLVAHMKSRLGLPPATIRIWL